MDDRVIYIRWSDDGRFIRKWDTKPFDGAEPMYSRSWLLSEERVEAAAEACWQEDAIRATGKPRRVPWDECQPAEKAKWRLMARAASAIGEPYEFSGWVEVVEDGRGS